MWFLLRKCCCYSREETNPWYWFFNKMWLQHKPLSICLFPGITVLLSLTVFMLLVAEIMPATSDSVPLIGMCERMFLWVIYILLNGLFRLHKALLINIFILAVDLMTVHNVKGVAFTNRAPRESNLLTPTFPSGAFHHLSAHCFGFMLLLNSHQLDTSCSRH